MPEFTNELIKESSPYLLQHAHNPVNWVAWNAETLQKAKDENKLLIISIGYAACHWCHVMEHESFEDKIVAGLMNDHFIPVKVDREERPDIDDIYMAACQLSNNRGCGWPLNAFALPDGRPVWAGTYFPKENWINILDQFITIKKNEPGRLEDAANQLTQRIKQYDIITPSAIESEFNLNQVHLLASDLLSEIDFEYGGRKGNPKFPMPVIYEYLLPYYKLTGNASALEATLVSLDRMAYGGIYDQVGGGFSRYSVDAIWLVPHFEKMLYDNGQLISLYANAYKLTGKPLYNKIIRQTLEYIDREMTEHNSGGFYSALDADSEGVEGKYYVWQKSEIEEIIGDRMLSALYCKYYNITDQGNWEHNNILYHDPENFNFNESEISPESLENILQTCNQKLLERRKSRIRPGTDDKILTSWNALMLKGYIDAYTATGDHTYLEKAIANANYLRNNQMDKSGRLNRNFKAGKSSINAFLDDYALVIQAFIGVYEATLNDQWLNDAVNINEYAIGHFYNPVTNMFYYTSDIDPPLITRKMELSDNVIPSSNSVMARNLKKLHALTGIDKYAIICKAMMSNMVSQIQQSRQPSFYANWCRLWLELATPLTEVAVCGPDALKLSLQLQKNYLPGVIIAGSSHSSEIPLLKERFVPGSTFIYVCKNNSCQMPVETVEEALDYI